MNPQRKLTEKGFAAEHIIQMTAEETSHDDGLGNKLLDIQNAQPHRKWRQQTHQYSNHATIPGSTIVLTDGDTIKLTIFNDIPGANTGIIKGVSSQVSVHVHGVHYEIDSDDTLEVINNKDDQGAGPGPGPAHTHGNYICTWNVASGTAGTWPYHDHNYETHNGAEHKGLFGAIIVNPAGSANYAKEFVLYLTDDSFWGMKIDNNGKKQKKHGVNPDLIARNNSDARFHLIALGTDIRTFSLDGYHWKDPGTENQIDQVAIELLEKHVFTVTATENAQYADKNFTNNLMGMKGNFKVSD